MSRLMIMIACEEVGAFRRCQRVSCTCPQTCPTRLREPTLRKLQTSSLHLGRSGTQIPAAAAGACRESVLQGLSGDRMERLGCGAWTNIRLVRLNSHFTTGLHHKRADICEFRSNVCTKKP